MSLLPNPLSYLDHYGYSNTLGVSRCVQIVREVTPLLRAGLRPCIRVQAETICLLDSGCVRLLVHLLHVAEHASLVLGRPLRRTTFEMDRSVLWATVAVMTLGERRPGDLIF